MSWFAFIVGAGLGSCVTAVLVWLQLRAQPPADRANYFARVALSVVVTSLVIGLLSAGFDYTTSRQVSMDRMLFSSGWLLGGLIAAWFTTRPMQRT